MNLHQHLDEMQHMQPGYDTTVHMPTDEAVHGGPVRDLPNFNIGSVDETRVVVALAAEPQADGSMHYRIVDPFGAVYAQATSIEALLPWLAGFALAMDRNDAAYPSENGYLGGDR